MASTFSNRLKIELIGDGEQAGARREAAAMAWLRRWLAAAMRREVTARIGGSLRQKSALLPWAPAC